MNDLSDYLWDHFPEFMADAYAIGWLVHGMDVFVQ